MNCFIYFYSRYVLDLLLNKNDLEGSRNLESSKIFLDLWQGILSVPGIAGYKWVTARIGRFYKDKIFFSYYQRPIKTGKTGTHLSADTSPVQCSLPMPNLPWFVVFVLVTKQILLMKHPVPKNIALFKSGHNWH